ncbi:MAG TPA: DinB family protein [Gemmatimonadaceae bacterium]|nr:DinB family protein [Gemmatimonadaceae bacterium]
MHPRIAELTDYLARTRSALLAAVDAVPESRRETPPTPGAWSVAQVLDHLALVEDGSTRLLTKRVARAREAGLGPDRETSSLLHSLDASGLGSRAQRLDAPEIVLPRAGATAAGSAAALRESRASLLALLREVDGLDLSAVRATHGRLGDIDAYQWVLFLGMHEARHTEQLAEIAATLREDGAG